MGERIILEPVNLYKVAQNIRPILANMGERINLEYVCLFA